MAIIKLDGTYMALPSGIKRGNPIPLDTTAVWYDRTEMEAYAQTGLTAYVGQILSLVDSANNSATAYMIMDTAGTLQEVGSATVGDNKSIVLKDGSLSLKNWGVQYYKWVDSEVEGEAGSHVLQVVDETHPWIAGLEPKVTTATDGTLEIAWYQPSTTTIEGVSSAITSVQTTVGNLTDAIGSAEDAAGTDSVYGQINTVKQDLDKKVGTDGATMTGDLILSDGSKAASEAVVDTKITNAVSSAGHLKREVVETLPNATDADPDTIYMMKKAGSNDYLEYILVTVEGVSKLEQFGDTTVDLSNYLQKVSGATVGNIATFAVDGVLTDSGIKATDFVKAADFETHKTEVNTALEGKLNVDDETYTSLASNAQKLENLPEIKTIGEGLTLNSSTGVLSGNQSNKIEGIHLGSSDNTAAIDSNKMAMIPVGGALLGLVKTSNVDNGITIAADGTMSVNRIATSKLFVADGDELVFNCGNA